MDEDKAYLEKRKLTKLEICLLKRSKNIYTRGLQRRRKPWKILKIIPIQEFTNRRRTWYI